MENLFFCLEEKTKEWYYQQFRLIELKKTYQWRLTTGTESIVFDSIYDVIDNLYQKDYLAIFKLPEYMDDISSSCDT